MLLRIHFAAIVVHVDHFVLIVLLEFVVVVLIVAILVAVLGSLVLGIVLAITASAASRGAALVALRVAAIAALLLHPLVFGPAVLEPNFNLMRKGKLFGNYY